MQVSSPDGESGRKPIFGARLRASGVTRPLAALATSVEQRAEKDPTGRDEESDDQPKDPGAVDALLNSGAESKGKREQERKPLPLADGGIAEAEAGEEEEDIGKDPHGRIIPGAGRHESPARRKRGSQDSNLEPPVLETGALAN
jgi:hypothetical protein